MREGGAIRAQTASAAITGSDDEGPCASSAQASLFLGRVTVKVDPFPTALSTVIVPPWRLTISATMYNPMPKPGITLCLGPSAR